MNNDIEKELKELQIQYDKVLKERNELKKENKLLKKDLEVLETLKNHIVYYPSDKYIMICVHKDNKDFSKVKEWLENDI